MQDYILKSYSGTAPDATLSADIDDTTLTVTCDDLTGWPDGTDGPFEVTLEPDTTSEEKCWGNSRSGNTITLLARGMEGSAVAHSATTTTVRHGLSALDMREANYAVSQTVGKIAAKGDIIVGSAANTFTKLGIGTSGQALIVSSGTLAYGKPTLAESDITGLVTDLAGKLDTPSTAIAKGSLLAGTGANVADSLAVGTDGEVLTADSTATAGVSWKSADVGQWTDYTPTITDASGTAITTGNGTLTGRYVQIGKMVVANVAWSSGSTTAVGSATSSDDAHISLPVAAASNKVAVGSCVPTVTSNADLLPGAAFIASGASKVVVSQITNGNGTSPSNSRWTVSVVASASATTNAAHWILTITYEAS